MASIRSVVKYLTIYLKSSKYFGIDLQCCKVLDCLFKDKIIENNQDLHCNYAWATIKFDKNNAIKLRR